MTMTPTRTTFEPADAASGPCAGRARRPWPALLLAGLNALMAVAVFVLPGDTWRDARSGVLRGGAVPAAEPTPGEAAALTPDDAAQAAPDDAGVDSPGELQGVDSPGELQPHLLWAFRQAARAAAADGHTLTITSGYRSPEHQQRLYGDAVAAHGSVEAARRWVLPPEESRHVRGLAIDVGPRTSAAWLERHGARWGLCRRYVNEWWHFEPLTLPGGRCPALEPDAGG